MSLPRDISPGTAACRALLVAVAVALLALQLAAGIGVVGFLALLTSLILVLWIVVEAAIRKGFQRRTGERLDHN